jgi:hypothetical protein
LNLANNKDKRGIDSGIFATLRTSNIYHLKAKDLKNKIEDKDSILESNLSNMMAALRGSSQYWNRICGDLAAIDKL